jgi:aldehyde:ferredoxin oxidoreductase
VIDSALVCTFTGRAIVEPWMQPLLQVITGRALDSAALEVIGARICDLERALAAREGLQPDADRLPERVLSEPLAAGDYAGTRIGQRDFDKMLDDYYALRGWDTTLPPAPANVLPG